MGFEKFINSLSRNLSYNTIEELVLENSAKKIFANHVIFDINFVIYYCIVELEDEINDIIKIIYSLQFTEEAPSNPAPGDKCNLLLSSFLLGTFTVLN